MHPLETREHGVPSSCHSSVCVTKIFSCRCLLKNNSLRIFAKFDEDTRVLCRFDLLFECFKSYLDFINLNEFKIQTNFIDILRRNTMDVLTPFESNQIYNNSRVISLLPPVYGWYILMSLKRLWTFMFWNVTPSIYFYQIYILSIPRPSLRPSLRPITSSIT